MCCELSAAPCRQDANAEEETSLFFPLGPDGFPEGARAGSPQRPGQGVTLVHVSAQPELFLSLTD